MQNAPNGIPYVSDYKNWKVISTTNRFDNKTLLVIFGNDVAMKAIAEHHTNPWPDGTTFAKAAWAQQPDENGDIKAGAFIQVEFMIKDAHKHASTEGWGFARWRGTDLKPYGKDAAFTNECTGCHAPVKHNDLRLHPPAGRSTVRPAMKILFVAVAAALLTFTGCTSKPVASVINEQATLSGQLPYNPLAWKVITSLHQPAHETMSTLYGNDLAVAYARGNPGHEYPAGAVLALVTWSQRDDPHWFGGRIPSTPQSIEFVSIPSAPGTNPRYERYQGAPLTRAAASEADARRVEYLTSRRAAVMP